MRFDDERKVNWMVSTGLHSLLPTAFAGAIIKAAQVLCYVGGKRARPDSYSQSIVFASNDWKSFMRSHAVIGMTFDTRKGATWSSIG